MKKFHLILFGAIALLSAGCDQATKQIAIEVLGDVPGYSFVADTVRFQLVSNPGAFLSLGARLPDWVRDVVFVGAVPMLLLIVSIAMLRAGFDRHYQVVGLAMMAGGGLGNWIDRLLNEGAVTDFVSIGLGGLRTGIFNLADVAVMVGVALVLIGRPARAKVDVETADGDSSPN